MDGCKPFGVNIQKHEMRNAHARPMTDRERYRRDVDSIGMTSTTNRTSYKYKRYFVLSLLLGAKWGVTYGGDD